MRPATPRTEPSPSTQCRKGVFGGFLPSVLFALLTAAPLAHAQTPTNPPATPSRTYDIAAFVWPSYHPDDRARIFWPDGIGEWQTVMSNKPKFAGHDQPRFPLWGYVNESDRYVMEMQIAAAADHGVNVFIYDWYWYDRQPFLEACLNEGFLKAKNNSRMKFYLMWANHDVTLGWDKRNADDAFVRKNKALIWKGAVDRAEFEKIARRWIEKYFSQPTYYKIDGKPVFMLYDLNTFLEGLGGVEPAKDAVAWFRAEVKKAGFPGQGHRIKIHNFFRTFSRKLVLQAARFRLRRKLPSEVSRLSNEITKRRRKPKFSGA